MNVLLQLLYGLIVRILDVFILTDDKHWVFGAACGKSYSEGSKYFLEYMLKKHPDYICTFVTQNDKVLKELKAMDIPCVHNFSLRGVLCISKASKFFTTHSNNDILYDFRKKQRKNYYLVHGQPLKVAQMALKKKSGYWESIEKKNKIIAFIRNIVHKLFISDMTMADFQFVSATSDFLKPFMEIDFDYTIPVKILGMPRNDGLFDTVRMNRDVWLPEAKGKFVVTYMPTHRLYGHGEVTPTPFLFDKEIQKWFKANNVIFLMKQHPNMLSKMKDQKDTDTVLNITKYGFDPQVVIYHSDVLITDFSSVWMDYLLLRRPCIFYIYDNFEQNDAGCHYDIREDPPGHFCSSEKELFNLIRQCKENYSQMIPSENIVRKYHKYIDGNSCQRYFDEIIHES